MRIHVSKTFALIGAVVLALVMSATAFASAPEQIVVSDFDEFKAATLSAEADATIYIDGTITITEGITIGDTEKPLKISPLDGVITEIVIDDGISPDETVSFVNLYIWQGGGQQSKRLNIRKEGDCTALFDNVTFAYSYGTSYIANGGLSQLSNCIFEGGISANGGYIYTAEKAKVDLTDCTLNGGVATERGGAIYSEGALTVERCQFFNNYAEMEGGAIFSAGDLTVSDSRIMQNSAAGFRNDICSTGVITISDDAEDYAQICSSDIETSNYDSAGWFLSDSSIYGTCDDLSLFFQTPCENYSEPVALTFALYNAPAQEADPESENTGVTDPASDENMAAQHENPADDSQTANTSDNQEPVPQEPPVEKPTTEEPVADTQPTGATPEDGSVEEMPAAEVTTAEGIRQRI